MRAAVFDRYGGPEVVRVADVPQPSPRAGEVLVKVESVAVTSGDARLRAARFPPGFAPFARLAFGVFRPRRRILGSSFAGEIAAVGAGVTGFAVGDRVCGMTGAKMGAHAEYVVARAARIAHRPAGVSADDAAGLLFGATTALYFLRDKAAVGPGMTVLVNGASGAVGTNAVQLARHFGATVTAVTSGANATLVTELGAAHVIDHTREDVANTAGRFDVVIDTVGNLSISAGRRLLAPGGKLLLVVAGLGAAMRARGDVAGGVTPERGADMELLVGLVAGGGLRVVLDQVGELHRIVDAYRVIDSGRKVGNIVVRP